MHVNFNVSTETLSDFNGKFEICSPVCYKLHIFDVCVFIPVECAMCILFRGIEIEKKKETTEAHKNVCGFQ